MTYPITDADFADPRLAVFVREHVDQMACTTPPESRHALDASGLNAPGVRLWVVDDGTSIIGMAGLAAVEPGHEEVKSMRTDPAHRGRGVASALLTHLLHDAQRRAIRRVSLETGTFPYFSAARNLYTKFGFEVCEPFAGYLEDPNSSYMTLALSVG